MFYDFIYLAKGFRMRPKVRSTLTDHARNDFKKCRRAESQQQQEQNAGTGANVRAATFSFIVTKLRHLRLDATVSIGPSPCSVTNGVNGMLV